MTEFYEIHASTGKNVIFRIFMLLTLALTFVILQLDVNIASLYADLEKQV